MRTIIVNGTSTLVETRAEQVEWYVREHPGVSGVKLDRDLYKGAFKMACSLYNEGILRSWKDGTFILGGKVRNGYRYAHILTPRDAVMDDEVLDLDEPRGSHTDCMGVMS